MKTLTISRVNAYNREVYKPECDASRLICEMLRQKNLTLRNIEYLKELGFLFKIEEKPI